MLNQEGISAHIGQAKEGTLVLWLTFNGFTKKVPMNYTFVNGMIEAKGSMSLANFSATSALASINKACFTLHKGKTWDDVSIWFSLPVKEK